MLEQHPRGLCNLQDGVDSQTMLLFTTAQTAVGMFMGKKSWVNKCFAVFVLISSLVAFKMSYGGKNTISRTNKLNSHRLIEIGWWNVRRRFVVLQHAVSAASKLSQAKALRSRNRRNREKKKNSSSNWRILSFPYQETVTMTACKYLITDKV